jgi:hypothetical protein
VLERQRILLRGGTFHGEVAHLNPLSATLRRAAERDGRRWSELYLRVADRTTTHHPDHGRLPVMLFVSRREE